METDLFLWRIDSSRRDSTMLSGRVGGLDCGARLGDLITIMRGVLEEAMTKVPAEQATTVTKAYLAEFILKAAPKA
jgi:hypothetical protein